MASTITLSVIEHKGNYKVEGDFNADGEYALVADFAINSFSGTIPGLGRFSASKTASSMMYRMEPDNDQVATALMAAALEIKAMIEEKFAPVQEP